MKYKFSLFLSALLLNTAAHASATTTPNSFLPAIKGARASVDSNDTSSGSTDSLAGSVGHRSENSTPSPALQAAVLPAGAQQPSPTLRLPALQAAQQATQEPATASYTNFASTSTSPHQIDKTSAARQLLATAETLAKQAEQTQALTEKVKLHKQSAIKYLELTEYLQTEPNKKSCFRKIAFQFVSAAYALHSQNPGEYNKEAAALFIEAANYYKQVQDFAKSAGALSNAAIATADLMQKTTLFKEAHSLYEQAGDAGDAQLMQMQYQKLEAIHDKHAQDLVKAASKNIKDADALTAKQVPLFPTPGQNIATPDAVQLIAQATANYKKAGDLFALINKPGDAAVCYANSASHNCYPNQRVQLLKLSAQQHLANQNPNQAQIVQTAADKIARHLEKKKAARAESRPESQAATSDTQYQ